MAAALAPYSCPLLDLMHHDALRAVLLWTRASDHLHLRLTCRRVRDILDSSCFRLERCQGGFAEITAVLSQHHRHRGDDDDDMGSDYDEVGHMDEEFGCRTNDATLVVDGRKAGEASFTILPRRNVGDHFHAMADMQSSDLVNVATTFFDGRGRPKLKSLQEALAANDDIRKGLLYLETFRWNDPVFRTTSWVGAKALRALLTETALQKEWSVVVYIPEAKAQFGDAEMAAKEQYWADKNRRIEAPVVTLDMIIDKEVEQKKKDKAWHAYCNVFAKRDMRQFLRAGFRQEQESVHESPCFYVYAVPSHLMDHPLLSHNDTMSIPILEKPVDTREPLGHDALKLVETMTMFCAQRKALVENLLDAQQQCDSPTEHSMYREIMRLTEVQVAQDLAEQNLPPRRHPYRPSPEMEQQWMTFLRGLGEEKKLEVEGKIRELDERVRTETVDLIQKAGTDIIASSDVLHACASNFEAGYLRMLVATIPEREKQRHALNAFNQDGQTPLMRAVVGVVTTNSNHVTIEHCFTTCQTLLELGANKSVVNAVGLTALGVYRKHCRDLRGFQVCMGGLISPSSQAAIDAIPAMETLLLPMEGATTADDEILKEPDEEDEDEDEWDDEDEMEEGDY